MEERAAFQLEVSWVLRQNARTMVYLERINFRKFFDIVSHCSQIGRRGLNGWNTTGVRDGLNSQAQRIMVSGSKATWWPITSTACLLRKVISSNIHVFFNHLHYATEHTIRKLREDNKLVECLTMLGCRAAVQKK
ncbi:hypothetical protein QYF61_007308 [Mycteria americana]|uniref:Uncharacterized protein n=1 Tax=Mycteria americana TaxID=33587 RepID=A0AAN7N230_MYCAM|nr:hypothetical protein QYF61_007308 [Mycteria americana]